MTPLRALTVFSSEPIIVVQPTISLVSGFWIRCSSWQSNSTSMPRSLRFWSRISNEAMPNPGGSAMDWQPAPPGRKEYSGMVPAMACSLMSYSSSYLSAYSQFRRPSSIQASMTAEGVSTSCVISCQYWRMPSASLMTANSPLLMELLPPPRTGAFSSTSTCCPHSSAPMRDAHMPAPP